MAVSFVLGPTDKFPAGTSVKAFKRSTQPGYPDVPTGAPAGTEDETAVTAADGTTTFSALVADTEYVAYGNVSSEHRYISFRTSGASAGSTEIGAASLAALENITADTEAPAAAALADGAANPSTPSLGSNTLVYNGTTWDRARGDTANGLDVDVTRVGGTVTVGDGGSTISVDDGAGSLTVDGTVSITANSPVNTAQVGGTAVDTNSGNKSAGTQRVVIATDQVQLTNALKVDGSAVTQPVSGTVTVNALPAGTNNIGDVDVLTLPSGTVAGGSSLPAGTNNIGDVDVLTLPALPAGNNNIGDVDVLTLPSLPAGTNAIGKLAANSGVDIGDVDVTSLPALPTGTNVIGKTGHDTTGIGDGRTTVTTAGTRVALASTTAAKWVTITAETDNTGLVVVGSAANVVAALATRRGTPLGPGESVTLFIDDLADVGLDSMVSTDGVTYTYGT